MNIENISLEVPVDRHNRADVMVKVKAGDNRKSLLIEVKSNGEPRIVQRSIYKLNTGKEENLLLNGFWKE